jgi:hypothetical protein
MAADAGLYNLQWSELAAWAAVRRIALTPWEASAIMSLSRTYTQQYHESDGKPVPAPWTPTGPEHTAALADKLRAALRAGNHG